VDRHHLLLTFVDNYITQVIKWASMDNDYLRSIWRPIDEEKAHECLEEVYSRKGFIVKNFHRDDRLHEAGIDILCTKNDMSVGFAVKKKPKQDDVSQLKKLADSDLLRIKFYIYLDSPTRPFEQAMASCHTVQYLDWNKFHLLLLQNGSIKYVLLYFGAHKLFENLSEIYSLLYDKRATKQYNHVLDTEETEFMWNLKDDAVKLKSSLEYLQATWRPILMNRLEYSKEEWAGYLAKLHSDLDVINNVSGESLRRSFISMSNKFPHLAAFYWELASCRTVWKDFTGTAIELGSKSPDSLREFIRYKWVVPSLEPGRRSSEYGPIGSVYSALWAVVESTYNIANDIEDGVDWLHHELIQG
jgi:hypothetical protein